MSGDNLNMLREGGAGSARDSGINEFTRAVPDGRREGKVGFKRGDSRLYLYDRIEGMSKGSMQFEVDKADRLPKEKAAKLLDAIHKAHGVDRSIENFLYNYDTAFFFCYAMNGASQLSPNERVTFTVVSEGGRANQFSYGDAMEILGVDARRFFRAFADDVVAACKEVYEETALDNEVKREMRSMLVQLAEHRGVSRYPWLVADCAEAALSLSKAEIAAVALSKQSVIGASTNAVDKRNLAVPIRSMDNFDSSTGASVSMANDIHGQSAGASNYYR